MNALNYSYDQNCQVTYKSVVLYLDYTNDRLKILDYNAITEDLIRDIIDFARHKKLGKILANTRIRLLKPFRDAGFVIEGIINGFFKGEDAYCLSYFLDKERMLSSRKNEEDSILHHCIMNKTKYVPKIETSFSVRNTTPDDIPSMISLFSHVFESYPSPVYSVDYLNKVMDSTILFKGAFYNGKLVSIASADMDTMYLNAEITDCATCPEYRGKGLLPFLITQLERDLSLKGFFTLYSLSRAINQGINASLSKLGYRYNGRLINNCHICGGFEDMNVWVKRL